MSSIIFLRRFDVVPPYLLFWMRVLRLYSSGHNLFVLGERLAIEDWFGRGLAPAVKAYLHHLRIGLRQKK